MDADIEFGEDRAVIILDHEGPFPLEDLSAAFAALARIYHRNLEAGHGDRSVHPKLYVSRLRSGSIEAEIVPLLMIMAGVVPYMDSALIIRDFTKWVGLRIGIMSGQDKASTTSSLSREDAEDLKEFIRPLSGQRGASLKIKHAKLLKRDGEREFIAEYDFNENEINRATVNLDKQIELISEEVEIKPNQKFYPEVLMIWHQASREPGRQKGRTGDRAIIAEISDKPIQVYFPKQTNDLKRRMAQEEPHPFSKGYIVDVYADIIDDRPRLYRVVALHEVVDLE